MTILSILGALLGLATFILGIFHPRSFAFGLVVLVGMGLLGYAGTDSQAAAVMIAVWLGAFSEALVGKA